jgi:threonyl-tRNA synthetase
VQYDFVMPKRFQLSFTNEHGEATEPIVIHRSSVGAIERTMAFLIEKFAGAFPLWLAPIQTVIIPIAKRHNNAAIALVEQLKKVGIRADADLRKEPMQGKVRDHTLQKVPYLAIIGDTEINSNTVSVRTRRGENLKDIVLADFQAKLKNEIETKANS